MTSSDRTYVGIAKQGAGKGTLNATDSAYSYFMFSQGAASPQSTYLASDDGAGGGPLPNTMEKVGVMSQAAFQFIPRPTFIGHALLGTLGKTAAPVADGTGWTHTFTMDTTDYFSVPYYSMRVAQGNMWGETFQDMRVAGLAFNWKAADFVRASIAFVGGTPTTSVGMTNWTADNKVDRGATFIAPVTTIGSIGGETVKVLAGQIAFANNIPLEEQWITGSYAPDDFDIVNRAVTMSFTLKLTSKTIYEKIAYDPAGGSAWLAGALKDGSTSVAMISTSTYAAGKPYKITVVGNAASHPTGNVAWQVTPIALNSGRQVIATVTGTFLGVSAASPVTVALYNNVAATY